MSPNAALALAEGAYAAVPGASPSPASITVPSEVLGELAVPADSVLTFPTGLFGFPECRRFALVASEREGLYWLQSADHAALVFLLVDPFVAVDGFVVELSPPELSELEATTESDVAVLAIVTLAAPEQGGCTVNLQGPLAINMRAKRARQIAVASSDYGVRYPIDLSRLP